MNHLKGIGIHIVTVYTTVLQGGGSIKNTHATSKAIQLSIRSKDGCAIGMASVELRLVYIAVMIGSCIKTVNYPCAGISTIGNHAIKHAAGTFYKTAHG